MRVNIIGAGLAGSEAAYQLASRGIKVDLYEQKGIKRHPAFNTDDFGELVCSNSLRSDNPLNAVGLLKNECRALDSLILKCADATRVEAGSSLSVDRNAFSKMITETIKNHPNITLHNEEVVKIPNEPTIIAAGPLLEGPLFEDLKRYTNADSLYFYDAVAPIIEKDSIDFNKAYYKSRYDEENEGDYINCPMNKDEFFNFYNELINGEEAKVRDMDKEIYFEVCMPVEAMAKRGFKTLTFGPLKPVGLEKDGLRPYAVVQLRKDNAIDTLYNMVGFQTHLTYGEQKRIFSMIPGLENAKFARYGVMHRNTYINSPKLLTSHYSFKERPDLFVAGQLSGVEGYVESCASGLYAAVAMYQYLLNKEIKELSSSTMMGAMAAYISNPTTSKLVPMNANFGIFKDAEVYKKSEQKEKRVEAALKEIEEYKEYLDCLTK